MKTGAIRKLFLYTFLFIALSLTAQVKSRLSKNLSSEDSIGLSTIASYPDSLRPAILQACQKPEILIKAEALQKSAGQEFLRITDGYSKEEQKKLWDLTRYPGLVDEISAGGKKSKEELENLAGKYPAEIKSTVKEYGRKHYEVITEMNTLYKNSQTEFEKILAPYPPATQSAYRSLINKPDILNTLSNNMHLVVTLGEMYKTDPKQTARMLDSVRTEQSKQAVKDLEEWKEGLEKDPEAKKELEQAAREFSEETKNGSGEDLDDVYKTGGETKAVEKVYVTQPVITNYYMQPYPYWFGYPWWYDHPYWYPYPYWYHSGFYWGPAGMVFIGFPSPFFMHWYLYHPYHHYYYPYLTDYYLSYHQTHYGPRNVRTGFNSEIHHWSRANEANLPKGYFNKDASRPQRIKELGRFEANYHNSTKGVFGKNLTRAEFLRNNPDHYPAMKQVIHEPRFNQPVKYPQQQNPVKFNMEKTKPVQIKPRGGFSPGNTPKGGTFTQPKGGGMRPRK